MSGNFFNVSSINHVKQNPQDLLEESSMHRLNGYDSGLLNEKSTQENNKLKLEYRISEKQNELIDLNGKIKDAEQYGTQSEVLGLRSRKQRLERELYELNREHSMKLNSVRNLNGQIDKLNWIRKVQAFLTKNLLSKFSKRFNSIAFLGDSLETLSAINRNVDALLEMNVPYGESKQNYEKLAQYLSKANKIHSQISKTMKNI